MKELFDKAMRTLITNKQIPKDLTINDIWFISEYENYYYFRLPQTEDIDDSGWKINKTTGSVEFQNWMVYAFQKYKNNKSIGELATILLNEP